MMNQQTDKFFRDKLEHHQKPASSAAWDRIDAELSKKNNRTPYWLKIAASILIVAVGAFILWPSGKHIDLVLTDKTDTPVSKDSVVKRNETPPVDHQREPESEKRVAEKKTEISEPKKKPVKQKKEILHKTPVTNDQEKNPVDTNVEPSVPMENNEETEMAEPNPVAVVPNETAPASENIKIVISSEDAEKFLDKKSLAKATSEEKKPSTLQKLLDKAEDLTTNQDPLGEIRQMKNEILALNFKNDKQQRGQNK
jgi:hypothetical protein